jgi:uncharacterized FAD-dependent dehydrogenase
MRKTKRPRYRIRNASFTDAFAIFNMIKQHPDELVPRSISDILQNIDRFMVAESVAEEEIIGTCVVGGAAEIGSGKHPSVEVKSLSVVGDGAGGASGGVWSSGRFAGAQSASRTDRGVDVFAGFFPETGLR